MTNEARDWKLSDATEITLTDEYSFLKIKETLTRLGIPNTRDKKLYQTAHILHKQQRYFIVHFKLLFALDGKPAQFNVDDWRRQNTIASLVEEWKMCTMTGSYYEDDFVPVNNIKILRFAEKDEWELVQKYSNLGKKSFNK